MVNNRKDYDFLFENIDLGLFSQDKSGNILEVNPVALEIFGLSKDQFLRTGLQLNCSLINEDGSALPPEQYPWVKTLNTGNKVIDFKAGIFNPLRKCFVWTRINTFPKLAEGEVIPFQTLVTLHSFSKHNKELDTLSEYKVKFSAALESMDDAVFISDIEGNFVEANTAFATFHRLNSKIECYKNLTDYSKIIDVYDSNGVKLPLFQWVVSRALRGESGKNVEFTLKHKELGEEWIGSYNFGPYFNQHGDIAGSVVVARDITQQKQDEEKRALLTRRLEALWKISTLKNSDIKDICDSILAGITQMTQSPYGFYGFVDESEKVMKIYSWSEHAMADCEIHKKPIIFKIEQSGVWGNAVRERKPFILNDYSLECENKTGLPEGHIDLTRLLAVPVLEGEKIVALAAVANKVTNYTNEDIRQLEAFLSNIQIIIDQKRDEEKRIKLERQLQQAQKVESIGLLAGGIAHDFNNMLGVILGHAEMALMKADPKNPFRKDMEDIQTAARRSADLTRQLLAFARKEAINPRVLDLNETIETTLKMLQRLIGENIHLSWEPGSSLWPARIDPSQIDQILANLCVNARDAISGVGSITISTQNITVDRDSQITAFEIKPGDYVCLSISDDGPGIEKEVLNKIFEPFFTSKELGQGTGLGLSTVYGAVKQNQGFIDVVSEPGNGATFNIYLPRQISEIKPERVQTTKTFASGRGTILLVEDDEMLLDLTKSMLEESGYTVLDAPTSDKAITLAKEYSKSIHLLLSDIVLPQMNGKDLRDILLSIRPGMKVIFMSGYNDKIISQHGVLDKGTHFLQKPFKYEDLTIKIKEVLAEASRH